MEAALEDGDEEEASYAEDVLLNAQAWFRDDWKTVINRASADLFDNMVQNSLYLDQAMKKPLMQSKTIKEKVAPPI